MESLHLNTIKKNSQNSSQNIHRVIQKGDENLYKEIIINILYKFSFLTLRIISKNGV